MCELTPCTRTAARAAGKQVSSCYQVVSESTSLDKLIQLSHTLEEMEPLHHLAGKEGGHE